MKYNKGRSLCQKGQYLGRDKTQYVRHKTESWEKLASIVMVNNSTSINKALSHISPTIIGLICMYWLETVTLVRGVKLVNTSYSLFMANGQYIMTNNYDKKLFLTKQYIKLCGPCE
jgi:hypothetical protein